MAKPTTVVNFILDMSGSMESVRRQTISGVNEYIDQLKTKGGNIRFTLTLFDTVMEKLYSNTPIKDVEHLTEKEYAPRGFTALYDAAVETIEEAATKVKGQKKTSSLVVIMTDGEENSSQKHDDKCLKDLIKKLESDGGWTFTFMGANQDAWATAQSFGISRGNTMSWDSTAVGTKNAMRGLADATVMYASAMADLGGGGSMKAFFNQKKGDDLNVTQSPQS